MATNTEFSGDRAALTVENMLKAPKVLEQIIIPEELEFLTDYLFSDGTTGDSGSVEYGVTAKQVEDARAGIIEEGAEIPTIDVDDMERAQAVAEELGLGYYVTDKARRRNQDWVLEQGNRKIQKGLLRANASRSLAAMNAAVTKYGLDMAATGDWSVGKNLRASIVAAQNEGVVGQFDYNMSTILVNPITANNILLLDDYENLAPKTDKALNPFFATSLDGVMGLTWLKSNLVPVDVAYIFEPKTLGVNLVEVARYVDVDRDASRRRDFVFGLESSVPVVTDPHSMIKLTGING